MSATKRHIYLSADTSLLFLAGQKGLLPADHLQLTKFGYRLAKVTSEGSKFTYHYRASAKSKRATSAQKP